MNKLTNIEGQVEQLSEEELRSFRAWFARFDAEAWDRQFEADAAAGRLDDLADQALRDHEAGRTTEL